MASARRGWRKEGEKRKEGVDAAALLTPDEKVYDVEAARVETIPESVLRELWLQRTPYGGSYKTGWFVKRVFGAPACLLVLRRARQTSLSRNVILLPPLVSPPLALSSASGTGSFGKDFKPWSICNAAQCQKNQDRR